MSIHGHMDLAGVTGPAFPDRFISLAGRTGTVLMGLDAGSINKNPIHVRLNHPCLKYLSPYIGVDEALGLVHSVATTAANVHDLTPADQLLRGEEKRIFADVGYQGIHKREEHKSRNVDRITWMKIIKIIKNQ